MNLISSAALLFGCCAAAIAFSWLYFRRWRISRPALGIVNRSDIIFLLVGIILLTFLYALLPAWIAAVLLALGISSILYTVWEPVLSRGIFIWLVTLGLLGFDLALGFLAPGSTLAAAANNLAFMDEQGEGGAVDLERARDGYRRAAELGNPRAMTAFARLLLGEGADPAQRSEALAWMRRAAETMATRPRTAARPWQIATLYVRAGEYREAIGWFEKACEERDPNMPYLSVDPLFDGLRDDPRFQHLLRRMNLPR